MQGKKVIQAEVNELDKLFRYIFMLVGLREINFPHQLETIFLYQFLRDNYANHTLEEIKLAFEKAVRFELNIDPKDVKCYENFSVLYFSSIMRAYRTWASDEYRLIEQYLPPPPEKIKQLPPPDPAIQENQTRGLIEYEYQHFLSFGDEHVDLFPTSFYDQLVSDNMIKQKNFYRTIMPSVRELLISKAVKEREKCMNIKSSIQRFTKNDRRSFATSINETNIKTYQQEIDELKSGAKDHVIEMAAKQQAVLRLFIHYQLKGTPNLYQRQNDRNSPNSNDLPPSPDTNPKMGEISP